MQFAKVLTDDEGVSPVIGVILMVAITVILAAVIAAFVLGIGNTDDPAPNVNLEYELTEGATGTLEISHQSGDSFEAQDVEVSLVGEGSGPNAGEIDPGITLNQVTTGLAPSDEFAAGNSVILDTNTVNGNAGPVRSTSPSDPPLDSVEIQLIWAPGGDADSVISEEEWTNVDFGVVDGFPV
jgi:flagellin-like protein